MADNVRLVTFNGQNVTPQDDALLYEKAVGENGIIYGADLSASGANTIHIDSGFGIICGRFFEISDSDLVVTLSGSGEINGRVIAHLDLSNTDSPFEIMVQTGNLSPLVQDEDVNIYNGTFEILLATFKVDSLSISNFRDVKPMVTGGFTKIANSQTITEEGYALDARQANESINGTLANIIMKALKSQINNTYKGTAFNFGIDASGNYGYIKAGADSVTPFRNPTGNAAQTDVLSGKTFSNASGDNLAGSMPTLTASDFTGSFSGSNYQVKSNKAGYVSNGLQVHSKAAGTNTTAIKTTASSSTVDIAITPGIYNKIKVDQSVAYNAGQASATAKLICSFWGKGGGTTQEIPTTTYAEYADTSACTLSGHKFTVKKAGSYVIKAFGTSNTANSKMSYYVRKTSGGSTSNIVSKTDVTNGGYVSTATVTLAANDVIFYETKSGSTNGNSGGFFAYRA